MPGREVWETSPADTWISDSSLQTGTLTLTLTQWSGPSLAVAFGDLHVWLLTPAELSWITRVKSPQIKRLSCQFA